MGIWALVLGRIMPGHDEWCGRFDLKFGSGGRAETGMHVERADLRAGVRELRRSMRAWLWRAAASQQE